MKLNPALNVARDTEPFDEAQVEPTDTVEPYVWGEDEESDIDRLQNRVDELEASLKSVQALLGASQRAAVAKRDYMALDFAVGKALDFIAEQLGEEEA